MIRVRKDILPLVKELAYYDFMFHNEAARDVLKFERDHHIRLDAETATSMALLIAAPCYLGRRKMTLAQAYRKATNA